MVPWVSTSVVTLDSLLIGPLVGLLVVYPLVVPSLGRVKTKVNNKRQFAKNMITEAACLEKN